MLHVMQKISIIRSPWAKLALGRACPKIPLHNEWARRTKRPIASGAEPDIAGKTHIDDSSGNFCTTSLAHFYSSVEPGPKDAFKRFKFVLKRQQQEYSRAELQSECQKRISAFPGKEKNLSQVCLSRGWPNTWFYL